MPERGLNMPTLDASIVVRSAVPEDWQLVRDSTIRMLTESPEAFGESLADIRARTDGDWRMLVGRWAERREMAALIAEDAAGMCGFVRGDMTDPQIPAGTALVSQLWTAARRRRTGLGRLLMNEIARWAVEVGADRVSLGVIETNLHVLRFYERLGYQDAGLRVPLRTDPSKRIVVLMRSLLP